MCGSGSAVFVSLSCVLGAVMPTVWRMTLGDATYQGQLDFLYPPIRASGVPENSGTLCRCEGPWFPSPLSCAEEHLYIQSGY